MRELLTGDTVRGLCMGATSFITLPLMLTSFPPPSLPPSLPPPSPLPPSLPPSRAISESEPSETYLKTASSDLARTCETMESNHGDSEDTLLIHNLQSIADYVRAAQVRRERGKEGERAGGREGGREGEREGESEGGRDKERRRKGGVCGWMMIHPDL